MDNFSFILRTVQKPYMKLQTLYIEYPECIKIQKFKMGIYTQNLHQYTFSHFCVHFSFGTAMHILSGTFSHCSLLIVLHSFLGMEMHFSTGTLLHSCLGTMSHFSVGTVSQASSGTSAHFSLGTATHSSLGTRLHFSF